jgi:hypothetical protein
MTGTSESVEKTTAEVHTREQCTYGQQKAICLEHFNFDYGVARLERRRYGDYILLDSETTRSLGSGCRWVIQHCSHAVSPRLARSDDQSTSNMEINCIRNQPDGR